MYEQLRRLFRHSAAYTLGSALSRSFAFILVPVYTRFLTQGEYGDLALLHAGAAVLTVFFELGVSSSVTRFYYDFDDERSRRRYIGSIWLFVTAVTAVASLALVLFGEPLLARLFEDVAFWPYVTLAIWSVFLHTANVIPWVLMRIREQSTRFVALVVGQSAVLLVAVVVFVVILDMGLLGAVLAGFLQGCAVYVFFTAYTLRNASLAFVWPYVRAMLAYGMPVLLLQAGWWVLDASDRFILRHFTSADIVAIYSVGYAIGRVLIMVSQAINQAWTPFFYQTVKEGNPDAKRIFSYTATYYALVVGGLGLFIVIFTREAVLFFGGRAYLDAATVTPLIVLATVVQGMFYVPSRGLFLEKKTALLPLILGVSAAVNVGLNLVLIPAYGMIGAAWATIAGYVVAVALTYAISQRYYRVEYQRARLAKLLGVLVTWTILASLVHPETVGWNLAWKALLLAGAPLLLWLVGFFEAQELAVAGRVLRSRWHRIREAST